MFSFSYEALSAVVFVGGQGPVDQEEQESPMLVGAHTAWLLSLCAFIHIYAALEKLYFLERRGKNQTLLSVETINTHVSCYFRYFVYFT